MAKKTAEKLERNEFGAPIGVQLDSDAAGKLHQLRHKKALKQLTPKLLKAGKEYFTDKYPDPEGAKKDPPNEGNKGDTKDDITVAEMKAKLMDHGVSVSPNASDKRITTQYAALLEEQADGEK